MHALTLRARFRLARFTRGPGPEAGPVQLERSRVFILPTRAGLLFGGMLLIMLLGAVNYDNSMAYLFTFLLGSMGMVSILHTYRNLARLRFDTGRAAPVFAGERAGFEILIGNPGPLPRFGIELASGEAPPVRVDAAAGQTTRVVLYRPAQRRGLLALGRFRVSSTVPLGLFRAWAHLELRMECLVYPRPGPRRALPEAASYRPNQCGDKGRGVDDFSGFRTYRPGDSPRHLFWKAIAREQAPLVKQFGGDRAEQQWLDWEALPGLQTEQRLSQLCRWVLDAHDAGLNYGLRLPGVEIPVGSGAGHKHRCLQALARFA
ncbi:MAG: DUF58 domain-containing protein [Gammaproteobacteria bacterium]|jgi:uncharacterized protein (DUF58 family)